MDVATIVIVTVGVALIFDIINGFHDAANSIATIVSTRVLSPRYAVLWAATFNFVALFIFQTGVAKTISSTVDRTFRIGQLFSAGLYSIGHGGNDAQKTIGVIIAVLVASGHLHFTDNGDLVEAIPAWIIFSSYGCMAFGTAIGGWRIVKTMGMGITHLKPVGGFCAEVAGAITLFGATHFKIPVSTTHTITGAIVGVGSVQKLRGIRWGLATRIVWAWILTIPAAGLVGAATLWL